MNGGTHIALTKAVCEVLGIDEERIWKNADLPDRVDDIRVASIGTHIFGRALCSLTHFQVPHGQTWRGYAWKKDGSLPLAGPNLPDRDVSVRAVFWRRTWGAVGIPLTARTTHPVHRLVRLEGYTSAADEMTWPTAASMADWLAKSDQLQSADMLGAILHFVQDAAVPHHVDGVLLAGHAEFEGRIQDEWHSRFGAAKWYFDKILGAVRRSRARMEPRRAVERCARETIGIPDVNTWDARNAIRRAAMHTAYVIRWWKAQ
jgi:hypothetical protein